MIIVKIAPSNSISLFVWSLDLRLWIELTLMEDKYLHMGACEGGYIFGRELGLHLALSDAIKDIEPCRGLEIVFILLPFPFFGLLLNLLEGCIICNREGSDNLPHILCSSWWVPAKFIHRDPMLSKLTCSGCTQTSLSMVKHVM